MAASEKVRFNDVRATYLELRQEIDAAMDRVLERGDFINGSAVSKFEAAFAGYCGSRFCVGTASGTASLHLALLSLGIGPGDEVITTPMTFIATTEAITQAGASIVFADIDPGTLNLDPAAVRAAITPRTRAIIFVHLHGNPSGLAETADIAARQGIALIEDAAQAHGAWLETGGVRRNAGTIGRIGAFSFFPGKNLGAFGDAGALITSSEQLATNARRLANHGREEKYRHLVEGFNYRLDTLQAAILEAKLPLLDSHVDARNRIASMYLERLSGLPLRFQETYSGTRHARHLFEAQTPHREALQGHLQASSVETGIHYPIPLHLQPAYAGMKLRQGMFPVAEKLALETLSLPLYPQLPEPHVERVCGVIREFFTTRTKCS